jgi:hypothetical protein
VVVQRLANPLVNEAISAWLTRTRNATSSGAQFLDYRNPRLATAQLGFMPM